MEDKRCGTLGAKTGKVSHPSRPQGTVAAFYHVFWGPLNLPLEGRGRVLFMLVFPRICHRVGVHYSVPEFAVSCLTQQRPLGANILCRNVTMSSWPRGRHRAICFRERNSFRVSGRASCGLSFGRVFASLWTQNAVAANTAEKWSYSQHRWSAHLNISMHTIPIKGVGLQKLAIFKILSLIEGKSRYILSPSPTLSFSLCFNFTWSEMRICEFEENTEAFYLQGSLSTLKA